MTLDKYTSIQIYSIWILKAQNKPTSNIYFENLLNINEIDWASIYMQQHLVAHNTYTHKVYGNVFFRIIFTKNTVQMTLLQKHGVFY